MVINSNQVKHIVIFKYKEKATPAQIEEVTQAFKALKGKIPGIVSFEYGVNNSPEGLNRGMTHVFLLTFANVQARDAYLPHPEHRRLAEWASQLNIIEDLLVIDYIPQS